MIEPKSEIQNQEIAKVQKEVADRTLAELKKSWYKKPENILRMLQIIAAIITVIILIIKLKAIIPSE